MNKNEMRYIVGDYCSQFEIDITEDQVEEAAVELLNRYEEIEEYNYRCGIRSVDIDILLDSYFSDFEEA